MAISLNSALSGYTSSYGSTLTPKIDKNGDNQWNIDELSNYTKAYQKATGNSIDAEALLKTYDSDEDGVLAYSEQEKLLSGDGLGLSALYGNTSTQETTAASGEDWIKNMSAAQSSSLHRAMQLSEQMSALFGGTNDSGFSSSFSSIISSQNAAKIYSIQTKFSLSEVNGNIFSMEA